MRLEIHKRVLQAVCQVMVLTCCATTQNANVRSEAGSRLQACVNVDRRSLVRERGCIAESDDFCRSRGLEKGCGVDDAWGRIPSPKEIYRCTSFCITFGRFKTCYFDLKTKCELYEWDCQDTSSVACKPVMVNLGPFEPRPIPPDREWPNNAYQKPPPDWGEYPLEQPKKADRDLKYNEYPTP